MGPRTTFSVKEIPMGDGSSVYDVYVSDGREALRVFEAKSEEEAFDYVGYMNNANHVWCDDNNYCEDWACQDRRNALLLEQTLEERGRHA